MNELARVAEFRELLDGYSLSKTTLQTLSQTRLVLLVAPTSSGRNTIIKELLKTGDYHFVVSDTTRQPRINDGIAEQSGHEYWFRTENEVLSDLREGKYLEAAIVHDQQVSGISVRELEKARDEGKIAITDAEIIGAANAIKYKPDTVVIFVLPPNFDEWQRRIKHRGIMSPEEFKRRMSSACKEFETALNNSYYQFVINESFNDTAMQINQIAKLGIEDKQLQLCARELAERLLLATRSLVSTL